MRHQGADRSEYFGKAEPPAGQELRYISGSEPESLDPQVSTGQPEARIYLALYEGLTEYHPVTGEAMPAIAERWEPNGDNSEFTFHLRHNARFSNGDPITAKDFVYTLRRGLRPRWPRAPPIWRTTSKARRPTTKEKGAPKTSASRRSTTTR